MEFKREGVFSGGYWWRCRFQLIKDGDLWVIRPDIGSKVEFYRLLIEGEEPGKQPKLPYEEEQNWAPHVHLARVENERDALAFANRWGLLGLWGVERYQSFLPDGGRDWYRWQFPPGVKPSFASLVCYQEPVEAFLAAAEEYVVWLDNLRYEQEDSSYKAHLLTGCYPRFGYDANKRRWSLDWWIESLYEAIYLRAALDMAGGKHGFRRCKRCNRLFLARHEKDRFCSYRCQNNYFASKSKKRKRSLSDGKQQGGHV